MQKNKFNSKNKAVSQQQFQSALGDLPCFSQWLGLAVQMEGNVSSVLQIGTIYHDFYTLKSAVGLK